MGLALGYGYKLSTKLQNKITILKIHKSTHGISNLTKGLTSTSLCTNEYKMQLLPRGVMLDTKATVSTNLEQLKSQLCKRSCRKLKYFSITLYGILYLRQLKAPKERSLCHGGLLQGRLMNSSRGTAAHSTPLSVIHPP